MLMIVQVTSQQQRIILDTTITIFISRNPLIGNDFAAIKTSVVKCARIAVNMNITFSHLCNIIISDLADKLLLLDY